VSLPAGSFEVNVCRSADRDGRFPAGNTRRSRRQIGAAPEFPREILEGQIGSSARVSC
jgi:hypothetical protein